MMLGCSEKRFLSFIKENNFGVCMPQLMLFYLETSYLTVARDFISLQNVNKSNMY